MKSSFLGNNSRRMLCSILLLRLALPLAGRAAGLEYAGVLGNSGVAGPSLVRVNTTRKAPDGGGLNCGVYLDRDLHVWTSGGDAFNCLSFDGRLLRRYPLTPAGSRLDTTAFAVLDGVLYALGHAPPPREEVVLFALPLQDAAEAGIVLRDIPTWRAVLCPLPREGRLLLGYASDKQGIIIEAFNPHGNARERILTLPGSTVSALALDGDDQTLYVGGYFGKYVGGNIHQPNVHEILKVARDGRVLWRRECLETLANPTQFRGVVSAAAVALWDTAWYGFFARFDAEGRADPGKITSWDMRIPYVSQVLDVRQGTGLLPPGGVAETLDPLLLAQHLPDQVYLAVWDDTARELRLQQRYGALPDLGNVFLSPAGWVYVSGLWWRFDDAANAAPSFANHAPALTPGVFRGDWVCALRQDAQPAIACVARPALGRESAQLSHGQNAPFTKAQGFAVATGGEVWAYATEAGSNRIWRTRMDVPQWVPRADGWEALTVAGEAPAAPGDVAALDDGSLVVADGGSIVRLEPTKDGLQFQSRLDAWGRTPAQHFGAHLRLAADGAAILVSDTDRQRVLLVDAHTFLPRAQYGITDQAGAEADTFNAPGAVALAGGRAVVADTGNQRVVKLRLTELTPPRA